MFFRHFFSKYIILCHEHIFKVLEVILQIYIHIYPIYLWGIKSRKAPNEKMLFQKKASKYNNLEVKCYVLSRVGWKHERTGIKIRAFCLKHFAQSYHMRSFFAKTHVRQKSTFLAKNNLFHKWPRSVWEWSEGIPDLSEAIFKQFLLKSIEI